MGQACSLQNFDSKFSMSFQQIGHDDYDEKTVQHFTEWTKDANLKEESKFFNHKIPKASNMKIKTLTQINLLVEEPMKKQKTRRITVQPQNLNFFSQFGTIKDLIEQIQRQANEAHDQQFKENQIGYSSDMFFSNNNQMAMSINSSRQKQRVFQRVQIKLENFLKISEHPITQYYDFKQKIGQGSFGNVYRAICKKSNQERAIKVLKKKQMTQEVKKQFLLEMQLLSSLDHPNIIKVYELYYYNFFYYVVTQLCSGGSILNHLNAKNDYGQKFVSKIMKQILSSVHYIHRNNIAHLDIKLENIVFLQKIQSSDKTIYTKLIDFGCSKYYTPYKKIKAKTVGTLSYISPEFLQGYYSEKCDMWAIGVLLCILLTGISPFKGKNTSQTRNNITKKQITFEGKQWSKVSESAKDLISCLLDRNVSKRISARSALKHEWFTQMKNSNNCMISREVLCNLQKYHRGNNLVTIIQTFLSLKKINKQQRKRLSDLFQQLDTDNNGTIQAQQLINLFKKHFGHHNQSQITQIIANVDVNNSGSINFNQFLVAMIDKKSIFQEQHLKEAFNYFDTDQSGYIQKEELKDILKGCQKEQFQFILKELDKDGDQKISKEEFINYLLVW